MAAIFVVASLAGRFDPRASARSILGKSKKHTTHMHGRNIVNQDMARGV